MFHKHIFIQSEVPEMLYCPCGETRDLHRHHWKEYCDVKGQRPEDKVGWVLKCDVCGELKDHIVYR